jgi:hypothetical protein
MYGTTRAQVMKIKFEEMSLELGTRKRKLCLKVRFMGVTYRTRGKHRDFSIATSGRIDIIGCIKCLKSEDEQSWADDGREAK